MFFGTFSSIFVDNGHKVINNSHQSWLQGSYHKINKGSCHQTIKSLWAASCTMTKRSTQDEIQNWVMNDAKVDQNLVLFLSKNNEWLAILWWYPQWRNGSLPNPTTKECIFQKTVDPFLSGGDVVCWILDLWWLMAMFRYILWRVVFKASFACIEYTRRPPLWWVSF